MANEPSDPKRRQVWLRLLVSLVLALAFAWALVGRIDLVPRDPWLPAWVLPSYLATLLAYFFFRCLRWHFLVAPLAGDDGISPRTTLAVAMAGTMWIMLLPLRLGELARPLLLAQTSKITISQALGTVALERVVDGLIVCGLFFAATPLLPELSGEQAEQVAWLRGVGTIVAALLLGGLLVLLAMAMAPQVVGRLVDATIGRVIPVVGSKLSGLARGIAEGLAALPSPLALLAFLGTTLAYWAINALGMWLLARGCGLPIDLLETCALMAVLGLSLLVPGGPGQFGIFHYGMALGLGMFVEPALVLERGSVLIFWMYVTQLSLGSLLGVLAQRGLGLGASRALS